MLDVFVSGLINLVLGMALAIPTTIGLLLLVAAIFGGRVTVKVGKDFEGDTTFEIRLYDNDSKEFLQEKEKKDGQPKD